MIVRIMGEGQWRIDAAELSALNELDKQVELAIARNNQSALTKALHHLNAHVRSVGEPLPVDALDESDLILPNGDASVEEVYTWLTDEGEGLVPDAD